MNEIVEIKLTDTVIEVVETDEVVSVKNSTTTILLDEPNPPVFDYTFIALVDTPQSYAGQARRILAVNTAENGLEFIPNNGGGGGGDVYWNDILDKPQFANVALTGNYADLSGLPSVPAKPADIGAAPAPVQATVATAGGTAAKVGATAGGAYTPAQGDSLIVTFTEGIRVNNPTLNIDGSGAKPIRLGLTNITTSHITSSASVVIPLLYDGEAYQLYGSHINTTYSEITEEEIAEGSSETGRTMSGRRAAFMLNRSNHKGEQPISSVSGLEESLNLRPTSEGATKIVVLSQQDYDDLTLEDEVDPDTLYFILEE